MTEFVSSEVVPSESVKTVAVQSDGIRAGDTILSTFSTETFADKKRTFIALDSAESLDDAGMIGKPFEIIDYATIGAEFANDETGVIESTTRVVLVASDGKSYHAFSDTLARSVQMLHASFGHPSGWDEPLQVAVVQGKSRKGHKFFKLDLIG